MQTLTKIRRLLAERGLRPRHRLGQNFLHDQNQLAKLVEASGVEAGDLVLEVGPGTGTLTEALLERGAEVVACELDVNMVGILEDTLAQRRLAERLTIVQGDVLASKHAVNPEVATALERPFRLVANLPYQIASPLIGTLLTQYHPGVKDQDHAPCVGQFITVQREVADRILAAPGTKAYGILSVLCALLAEVRRIATVPASCFWPAPKVTSAMIAVVPREKLPDIEVIALSAGIRSIFAHRRKQLGRIMRQRTTWPAGINPQMRAEMLTPQQILELLDQHEAQPDL